MWIAKQHPLLYFVELATVIQVLDDLVRTDEEPIADFSALIGQAHARDLAGVVQVRLRTYHNDTQSLDCFALCRADCSAASSYSVFCRSLQG